jgi:hypothetical protein
MSTNMIHVPDCIAKCHKDWRRGAIQLEWIAIGLGVISVTSSIAVTALAGSPDVEPIYVRILAAVSASSVALLSFFQVNKKITDYWTGWKSLNGPMVLYQEKRITLDQLVASYEKAEILVGTMEFRNGPASTSNHSGVP